MGEKVLKYFFIVLSVSVIGFIVWYFKSLVVYILLAVIFSLIGQPLVSLIDRIKLGKIRISRSLNAGITLSVIWLLFFLFFRFFIPLVAHEAQVFANIDVEQVKSSLEEPLKQMESWFGQMHISEEGVTFQDYISEKIVSVLSISQLSTVFQGVAGMTGNIFVAMFAISFITFFFLKEKNLFSKSLLIIIPEKYAEKVRNVLSSSRKLLMRYFIGLIIEISLVMILITIGLLITGIEFQHAIVIGLLAGMLNVIPYVGPIIGTLFGLLLGAAGNLDLPFYTDLLPLIGYMAIVFLIVQILDNVVFQPLIYANSVNAHPLEIFLVIMIAGSLAGITGMVLAIPIYTLIRVIAREFFDRFRVVQSLTKNL